MSENEQQERAQRLAAVKEHVTRLKQNNPDEVNLKGVDVDNLGDEYLDDYESLLRRMGELKIDYLYILDQILDPTIDERRYNELQEYAQSLNCEGYPRGADVLFGWFNNRVNSISLFRDYFKNEQLTVEGKVSDELQNFAQEQKTDWEKLNLE